MLLAIIVCAELFQVYAARFNYTDRSIRAIDPLDPGGCYHEGRWHAAGAPVRTRAACLRCTCVRGVLACARRACAPLPDPPPRCHVLHRKGSCCPELHCPDGVKLMELGASARFEDDDFSEATSISSVGHACVEGGSVFGAGSALAPGVACEQCFCLGGARRCVRPTCLPPPRGCVARPAPGACCPQRYYCSHEPPAHGTHDCMVEDTWYKEGERISTAERACTQCFCLHGAVRCQPLSCAPPLLGCKPLLRPGECCPHQYHCEHDKSHLLLSSNSLISVRNDDRSLHTSESNKVETSTKAISTSTSTKSVSTSISITKGTETDSPTTLPTEKAPVSTSKVKRKTDELHTNTTKNSFQNVTSTTELPSMTLVSTTEKLVRSNFETSTIDLPEPEDLSEHEDLPETTSTEQPEGSVRIVINGTINCTAELSSTSLPLNLTVNDTERIKMEAQPRIPILTTGNIESHTFNPNDIITDRSVNGEFDDNEMFTINVTSSLSTNSSRVTLEPLISTMSKVAVPTDLPSVSNMSKKTNEFDFDYAEPTLPPSLPNLKIIPFVAADAVVDEESPKEVLTYPILEREDKYPVYYPTLESKDTPFATRREDIYHPTQYPVFTSEKVDTSQYPALIHEVDISGSDYPTANNNLLHEQALSASLGSHALDNKAITKIPSTSTTFKLETPSINLFSPPVETEGGFIPKGPGIIDEYYAVYPSTSSAPSVPHLTTSMQLDTGKDCLTADGHRVPEGTSMDLMCSVCSCTWGKIHCSPRACLAPDGCYYNPELRSSTADVCCGELVCIEENETTTTTTSTTTTEKNLIKPSESTNHNSNKSGDKITTQNKTVIGDELASKLESKNSTNEVATTVVSEKANNDKHNISTTPVIINAPTTTEAIFTSPSTSTAAPEREVNQTHLPSQDYEEEDDEGFSFGSVLKLLLSDSYDATTAAPQKKKPVITTTKAPPTRTTSSSRTSTEPTRTQPTSSIEPPKPAVAPFVPMPHHYPYPYVPPKKTFQQNTVNRIDHLVLGEATAIRKPTPRPLPFKPVSPKLTTPKPKSTTRKEIETSPTERAPANVLSGVGGLKLAGCNIYGRMYRVGRIIAELSTPCQECRCTELGVQCRPLAC
ncbi:mucin-2-like [Cydia pomonella]|uniref:mucin-2-like n=1 Tax=Cydia pomonella TaxID=82600 RepID=UPI002ADDF70F|nr:mucin-2-like [Cydia pomonella]